MAKKNPPSPPRVCICLTVTLLLLALVAPLAGCGKKGDPVPPPDEPITYPRAYPHE